MVGRSNSKGRRWRLGVEQLERRLLLYHGPTVFPDGSVEVVLDEVFDQFGFQPAVFQAYEDLAAFSIFDTGASVITFSANDQFIFQLGGPGIPIKVPDGGEAEGIGGTLVGDVSEPGTIRVDGLHISTLQFDEFGFPVFELNFTNQSAVVPGVQAFVGKVETSFFLPTVTGTPILATTPDHPNGLAALVRPQGELLDFSGFPGLEGLVIPVPDVAFQEPGLGIPPDPDCTRINEAGLTEVICTDPVQISLDHVGVDNHLNPGDELTQLPNPIQSHVTLAQGDVTLSDQVFLFDSGAQLSTITTAQALALGFDLSNPVDKITVLGAAGLVTEIPGFFLDRLSLPLVGGGTLSFRNVPIYVLDVTDVVDGLLGMNLFNHASGILYDPFDPAGEPLQVSFFTEHLLEVPEISPEELALMELLVDILELLDPGQGATLDSMLSPFTGSVHLPTFSSGSQAPDLEPPRVTGVAVRGTGWDPGVPSYQVPDDSGRQLDALPWVNLDQFQIAFSEDVLIDQQDMSLSGAAVSSYSFSQFDYDSGTFTATWTLAAPIEGDKLLLELGASAADPVRDLAGNLLDGEWTDLVSMYPSGNGAAGGPFQFRLNVLPGDVNGDGAVNVFDALLVRLQMGQISGDPGFDPRRDVNADGAVSVFDALLVRLRIGDGLAVAEPSAAVVGQLAVLRASTVLLDIEPAARAVLPRTATGTTDSPPHVAGSPAAVDAVLVGLPTMVHGKERLAATLAKSSDDPTARGDTLPRVRSRSGEVPSVGPWRWDRTASARWNSGSEPSDDGQPSPLPSAVDALLGDLAEDLALLALVAS